MGAAPADDALHVLAGRYRLERVLARGGMGTVYEALDLTTHAKVALKRLNHDLRKHARVRVLFELEFHTLARLTHPRIIRVHESGIDAELPFYTMELLAGRDLRELAPVTPGDAASYLRDVASSLALLHTRRLLHRDLSPRNVRRTDDGRCKLLDFGTMAPFGVPETLVGTPPLVPPEALQGVALDQRADLYSLGALGYFLLTGVHAYPARKLEQLPQQWRTRPQTPARLVAGIPDALDELVMALLHLDRMRRPASAAEVIDALQRMFTLPPLEEAELEQSYFLHTPVIGRDATLSELSARMDQLSSAQGSVLILEGPTSIGRSRMLDEASLLAQTRGLVAARVGALDHRAQHGVLRALARSLNAAAPGPARAALRKHADEVLPLLKSSGTTLRYGSDTAATDLPGEARARQQRALTEWLLSMSRETPLVLLIDDVARADELSLSLLAALAHEAHRYPLLLIVTRRDDDTLPEPAILEPIKRAATVLPLAPLSRALVRALVASLFGETVSDLQLGDFLHRQSGGNPGLCLELARNLVEAGTLRYADGQWTLTGTDFAAAKLGGSIADALSARIAALDPHARLLANLAGMHRGPIPIHLWLRASGLDEGSFFGGLERLSREGLVVSSGDGYGFAQESMRGLLRDQTAPPERARLHLALAEVLSSVASADDLQQLSIGWHLVQGGRERQGAELLAQVAPRLMRELIAMDVAIPALETALEILERTGAPPALSLHARGALGRAAYLFDHELERRHGQRTLELLHHEVGLPLGDKLRPVLGAVVSVRVGFVWSMLRNLFRPAHRKGPDFLTSITAYITTLTTVMGVRATALDTPGVSALAPYVESIRGFVGLHAGRAAYLTLRALLVQVLGRESALKAAAEEAIRFASRPLLGMHPADRRDLLTGLYTALGASESLRGGGAAMPYIDKLRELGTALGEAAALRVRLIHHMQRGEWTEAEQLHRALELHAIQGGATWQVQWFATPLEASLLLRSGDVAGARRAIEQLRALARVRPSLEPLVRFLELGLYYRRGDLERARSLAPELLAEVPPCSRIGWGELWAVAAAVDCQLGDYTRALERCNTALAAADPEDLSYVTLYGLLEVTRAWALAGTGQLAEARAAIDAVHARRTALGDKVGLFEVHSIGCFVAQLAGDHARLDRDLAQMVALGRALASPGMLAIAERTARTLGVRGTSSRPPGPEPAQRSDAEGDEAITDVIATGPQLKSP